jgi:ATP-dependent Clp protease ATP-binding subunit ClpB
VFNILLQVLDDGRLTDSKGRTVNFTNTIVIMTSNLGTEFLQDKLNEVTEDNRDELVNTARAHILELLRQRMRPEFLNRIDEIILFKPLTRAEIRRIVELQLRSLRAKLSNENISIAINDDVLDWIAQLGYDPQYGARPLKRALQRYVTDILAMKILGGEFSSGDTIVVSVRETGGLDFAKQ